MNEAQAPNYQRNSASSIGQTYFSCVRLYLFYVLLGGHYAIEEI